MTFGINGAELIILILLAVLVLGPEKLPEYARKLTEWIRNLRRMAEGAKTQFQEETGTDFDEIDWKRYDPRQYDPRRIIRDALSEPVNGDTQGAAAASISDSPEAPSAGQEGLRGDLQAVRSQRDTLRDDLQEMDPRSLLFGSSSRRRASGGVAAAAGTVAAVDDGGEPAEPAEPATADSAADPVDPVDPVEPGQPVEPSDGLAPFDADAT